MFVLKRLGITRYEGLLGVGILAIGVLSFLPTITRSVSEFFGAETEIYAGQEVETFARSIAQFHHETGQWPAFRSQESIPQRLMGTMTKGSATEDTNGLFDEKPMPLDPWENPFIVRYFETAKGDSEDTKNVMVISLGPNGRLDSFISEKTHLEKNPFGGDDVGYLLNRNLSGSNN